MVVKLPDTRVVVGPDRGQPVEALLDQAGGLFVERISGFEVEVDCLDEVAPRTELQLTGSRIAVPNGL